jgi:DNA polymerase III subunit beta
MTFKIDKTMFQDALTRLNPFLEKKDVKSAVANYFVKVDNCILTLCATDYNFSLKLELTSAYDPSDGEFLVNGNDLLTIIKRLKSGEIELTLKGDELSIKQGRSTLKLQTLSTRDYPSIDIKEDDMKAINISGSVLYGAIKKTLFSVDSNNPKYELNAMLFDFNKSLKIVSTNTRALSIFDTKF